MAVDAPEIERTAVKSVQNIPSLRSFFAYVVNYPGSVQAWRQAIHRYLPNVEDLLTSMEVIKEWLQIYESKDLPLSLGEVTLNEQGTPVPKIEHNKKLERVKGMLLPPLDKVCRSYTSVLGRKLKIRFLQILVFLQALLDSSFIKLIQEPAALEHLFHILELIQPHISVNTELESLRGPLAPFDKARAQAVATAKEGRKKGVVDWRKRRKQDHELAALALGAYQVEELIF